MSVKVAKSIESILSDLTTPQSEAGDKLTDPVTIWLPKGYGARWSSGQTRTKRRLSKTAREVLVVLIDEVAETA